jgi:hypothetical protein
MSILKVDELQSRTSGNRVILPDVIPIHLTETSSSMVICLLTKEIVEVQLLLQTVNMV